jgi:hypothetical protein
MKSIRQRRKLCELLLTQFKNKRNPSLANSNTLKIDLSTNLMKNIFKKIFTLLEDLMQK